MSRIDINPMPMIAISTCAAFNAACSRSVEDKSRVVEASGVIAGPKKPNLNPRARRTGRSNPRCDSEIEKLEAERGLPDGRPDRAADQTATVLRH